MEGKPDGGEVVCCRGFSSAALGYYGHLRVLPMTLCRRLLSLFYQAWFVHDYCLPGTWYELPGTWYLVLV